MKLAKVNSFRWKHEGKNFENEMFSHRNLAWILRKLHSSVKSLASHCYLWWAFSKMIPDHSLPLAFASLSMRLLLSEHWIHWFIPNKWNKESVVSVSGAHSLSPAQLSFHVVSWRVARISHPRRTVSEAVTSVNNHVSRPRREASASQPQMTVVLADSSMTAWVRPWVGRQRSCVDTQKPGENACLLF